jgi:hypothetical protein
MQWLIDVLTCGRQRAEAHPAGERAAGVPLAQPGGPAASPSGAPHEYIPLLEHSPSSAALDASCQMYARAAEQSRRKARRCAPAGSSPCMHQAHVDTLAWPAVGT